MQGEQLPVVADQDQILLHGHGADHAVLVAVLRDMGHVQVQNLLGGEVGGVHSGDGDLAAAGLAQAGDTLNQLGLAVAVHAAHAQDFAALDGEAHVL